MAEQMVREPVREYEQDGGGRQTAERGRGGRTRRIVERAPKRRLQQRDALDERQFMMEEKYEIFEKQGPPLGALSLHYHNFYEIIYIVEGEFSSLVEDQTYHLKKGDFLLIDCNVLHKYHYIEKKHETSTRIVLWITRQMLEELSGDGVDLSACFTGRNGSHEEGSRACHFPIYYEEMLRGFLYKLAMSEIIDMELPGARAALDRGYLTLFFVYLNALCGRQEYLFTAENMVDHPMVETVSAYIEEHIGEPILVEELAEQVHMSKYHFLRKFKELTGMTAHSFVVSKRLIRACEELRERDKSITQIYQDTGFSDYSSFLRNFHRAYGVAPGKYRNSY